MKALNRRSLMIVLSAIALATSASSQSADPDLPALMERVRERVKQSYIDLQRLAWTDILREETLKEDRTQKQKPRESVSDMIIRLLQPTPEDNSGVPFYIREQADIRLVDGKPATKKDKPPTPTSANLGSLLFLLTKGNRAADWSFFYAGQADMVGRRTFIVDITYPQKVEPRVTWDDHIVLFGVRYEFLIEGVIFNKGRLWVDAATYDVLRLDWRSNPFEFTRPNGKDKFTFTKEMTARFKSTTFENPSQTLLVPESIENIATMKGGKYPVIRTLHSFGNYKRFTGDIQITPYVK